MIHATLQAVEALRILEATDYDPALVVGHLPGDTTACDKRSVNLLEEKAVTSVSVARLLDGHQIQLPTCPICTVLWDQALTERTVS